MRKYQDAEQRERSICKGYGFGKISTVNHFETPYIESNSRGFYDDKFFTPMVYQYLQGSAFPSANYGRGGEALPIDPDTGATLQLNEYIDYDGNGNLRATTVKPSRIDLADTANNGWGEWKLAIQLRGSTHRCWNWGRPDICWDALNGLGFPTKVIGTRPANPNTIEEEVEE